MPSRFSRFQLLLGMACVLLLAGCSGGGGGSGGSDSDDFVDPTGEYKITVNQTVDTCMNLIGQFEWGGATLVLDGNILHASLPETPGSMTCADVAIPYVDNVARVVGSVNTVDGTCEIKIDLDLSLLFTEEGFTGSYTISEETVSGDCSARPDSCERMGTLAGDPGLGFPPC